MVLNLLNKIPFITRYLDKLAEKYILKKLNELTGKDKQLETLKEILIKEVEEKQFWKNQVEKVRIEERQTALRFMEYLTKQAIDMTFDRIQKDYHLVPKINKGSHLSLLGSAILGRNIK